MDEVKANGKDLPETNDKNMDKTGGETKIEMVNGKTEIADKDVNKDNTLNDSIEVENDEANRSSSPLVCDLDDNERYGDLTKYNDEKPPQDHVKGKCALKNM
jgi:hypothetical protein